MNQNNKGFVSSILRRVIFAVLVILGAWLFLFALRGFVSDGVINFMNSELSNLRGGQLSLDSRSWDWSQSLFNVQPTSSSNGQRMWTTVSYIALSGALSLGGAAVLLYLGFLLSRATQRPGWLARVRSILRLLLISGGASFPFFIVSAFAIVLLSTKLGFVLKPGSADAVFWSSLFASIPITWLLVQAGHGEMARRQSLPYPALAKHMAVYLFIRLLNLVGVILVIGMFPGSGIGLNNIYSRDFPLMFSAALSLAVTVVLVKLAADIMELTYNRFSRTPLSTDPSEETSPLQSAIPNGWLIFSLVLVSITVLVGLVGPILTPYHWNEIMLQNRLAPPGPGFILGTDNVGRDILSRILNAIRIAIVGEIPITTVVVLIAGAWALLAENLKKAGKSTLEGLVMLPVESLRAFPWLVLVLVLLSLSLQGLLPAIVAAGLAITPRIVTLIREAISSSPQGENVFRSVLRAVPVAFLFTAPGIIIFISAASYMGLGVPPPYPELGGMLSGTGRQFMMVAPWMAISPAVTLFLLLLIWVMAGDALLEKMGFRSKAVWSKVIE